MKPCACSLRRLRTVALIVLPVGAAASVSFTLHAGHNNKSLILVSLFVIWVLSPFLALIWANAVSKRWSASTQTVLYSIMLIVPVVSAAIYGNVAMGAPRSNPAAAFLVVPLLLWVLIAVFFPAAAFISRRQARRGD